MDENPYRSPGKFTPVAPGRQPRTTIGRLLGLAGFVLIGSAVGLYGGLVVFTFWDSLFPVNLNPMHIWLERGGQRMMLSLFGGLIGGGFGGVGFLELIKPRPRVSPDAKRP